MLLVLIVLVLSAGLVFAGEPKTKQGTQALCFTMYGLGFFGVDAAPVGTVGRAFSGTSYTNHYLAGFGGKWYAANDVAVRGTINFNMNTYKEKPTSTTEDKTTTTTIGIAPAVLWHMMNAGMVSGYWGFGGQFGWVSWENTPPTPGTVVKSTGTMFGVAVILGADVFFWDNVSLGAEYNVGFQTNNTKIEASGASTDGPSWTNIGIDSWAVNLYVYIND